MMKEFNMSQQEKGKNIFQQAMDAVSNRDEKAAIEAAMKRAEELEQKAAQTTQKLAEAEQRAMQTAQKLAETERKVSQLTTDLTKAQSELATTRSELTTTRSDLATAKSAVIATEQRMTAINIELQKYVSADQAKKIAEASAAAARSQIIAEHTLKADETLSHLSLKYYGSAYEPYWRVIYEANKELIGDNPGRVRPGMVIKIPVLPEELKKK